MDFHSLTRRELQSLCKQNKIPANITNVAMADALQALETVVGIEEFLAVSQSETAESVEASSPKALHTQCRTSTRQKHNDLLKTPAVPRTTRKVPETSTRSRNVNNQETLVENTRRSTRLTEKKKSAAPKAVVKIDSFCDQAGNSNAEVEDICNKLDVVVIEEEDEGSHKSVEEAEDSGDVKQQQESDENSVSCEAEDNFKSSEEKSVVKPESSVEDTPKSGEEEDEDSSEVNNLEKDLEDNSEVIIDEVCDLKPDSVEDENLEQMAQQEHCDASDPCEDEKFEIKENNVVVMIEEENSGLDAEMGHEDTFCAANSEMNNDSSTMVSSMIVDNTENQIDEITTQEMEEMAVNMAGETIDAIPTMAEEVEDLKPIQATPFKNMLSVVSDDKENNVDEGTNIKNEKITNFNDFSIRQLKKQLKALTLKTLNSKEEAAATRPALQPLCENQMVVGGGKTENN